MKIYLSPSTQGKNIGVGTYGTEEVRMNLLTDILKPMLEKYGHTVYRNKASLTLVEVVSNSDQINVDLHLALHTNANNGLSRGCLVFCHKFGGTGEKFARSIYKYLEPLTPSSDLGVKEGYNYYNGKPMYELAHTHAPAVLVEIAFHDNVDDATWIVKNMTAIASAITSAINEVAGIETVVDDYKAKYDLLVTEIKKLVERYGGK